MDEEEPKILLPVLTGNIVIRDLPFKVKDRLVQVRRKMEWNSWADMAYWVLENSEKVNVVDFNWPQGDTGFIVCRDLPVEVRDELGKLKRIHGWAKWTDMIPFVLNELEVDSVVSD